MQFLAPLFLVALAALAAPIFLHLRRQQPRDRVPFSVVQFLDADEPSQRRRVRIEHLFLLLLRCLALALLALAFARPFFGKGSSPAPVPATARLILIDTSASMRGARFAQALEQAKQIVSEAGANDVIAVAGFDRTLSIALSFERSKVLPAAERRPAALAACRALRPGWFATDLGSALTAAGDLLDQSRESTETPAVLHVVSDFQRGASTVDLADYAWPDRLQVVPAIVSGTGWTNAGLHPSGERRRAGQPASVRVTNAAGSSRDAFEIQWEQSSPEAVRVAPGKARSITLPPANGGGVATLKKDDFDFDNQAWIAPTAATTAAVNYLGAGNPADSRDDLFFLQRALTSSADYQIEFRAAADAALTIVDGPLTRASASQLRAQLRNGAQALLVLRDESSAATLAAVTGKKVSATEALSPEPALIGRINFEDPVFHPFADPKFSNFSQISIWHHRRIDPTEVPGSAVLAALDSGDPLLLRVPVGRGTLFVLTTSWRPADSQLALSSKFAPLLHSILSQSSTLAASPGQIWVGDTIALPATADARVKTPNGKVVEARERRFRATTIPGLYESLDRRFSFAVNVRPAESEITPLVRADLESLGLPLKSVAAIRVTETARNDVGREEREHQQKLWWWLILAAAVALLGESAVSAWISRPRTVPSTP